MSTRFRCLITAPLLLTAAAALCGCSGLGGLSDIKDAEWFNRPSRVFNRSLALETPPLTEQRPIAPDDLISAEGYCSGMAPPSEANAMTQSTQPDVPGAAAGSAGVALGRTECEVARYAGRPDNVELSSNPGGERTATLTYLRGLRPGIYRFVGGRLTLVERAPGPAVPDRPAKQKKRAT